MVLERILLQTIKFDLQVEHPYMFLLRYVKQLKGGGKYLKNIYIYLFTISLECFLLESCGFNFISVYLSLKGDKSKVCKVLQMAWTFVNDR